jgi:hypothetical protein
MESMLSSFIKGIVSRASAASASASSVVLGRWGIQYDPKIIRIKIDQANEDHCGCCVPPPPPAAGSPVVGTETTNTNTNTNTKTKMKTRYEKIQDYLLPYIM